MLRQKIDSERLLDESSRWIVTIPSAETVDAHTVSYVSNYYILLGGNSIVTSFKQNDTSMRQNDQDSKMKTVMAAQAEYRNIDDLINNIYAKIERAKYH